MPSTSWETIPGFQIAAELKTPKQMLLHPAIRSRKPWSPLLQWFPLQTYYGNPSLESCYLMRTPNFLSSVFQRSEAVTDQSKAFCYFENDPRHTWNLMYLSLETYLGTFLRVDLSRNLLAGISEAFTIVTQMSIANTPKNSERPSKHIAGIPRNTLLNPQRLAAQSPGNLLRGSWKHTPGDLNEGPEKHVAGRSLTCFGIAWKHLRGSLETCCEPAKYVWDPGARCSDPGNMLREPLWNPLWCN